MTTATTAPPRPQVSAVRALRSIHRLEVVPNLLLVLMWGMFVAADRPSSLWMISSFLALGINWLSLFSGFVLNSYSDYPIDARSPVKFYIARGVERLGKRRVLAIYIGEQIITIAMALIVSVMLRNFVFVLVKMIGIMAGYLYNAEPIRLKRRGLWNPVMNSIRMGFVPGLIGYLAVHQGRISAGGWMLLIGMTLATMGRIGFWVTVMDRDEDAAEGIHTPSVLYGPRNVMWIAIGVLALASVLTASGLAVLFGPWAAVGVIGGLGGLAYRITLAQRTPDDRAAVDLLRTRKVIRTERLWDKALYGAVIAVGIVHLLMAA
jgi:lycopene elongase/hydratase (dihydrobisanhydrobacterioruberin-forming)